MHVFQFGVDPTTFRFCPFRNLYPTSHMAVNMFMQLRSLCSNRSPLQDAKRFPTQVGDRACPIKGLLMYGH